MSQLSVVGTVLFLTNLILLFEAIRLDTCPVEKGYVAMLCIYLFVSRGHSDFN